MGRKPLTVVGCELVIDFDRWIDYEISRVPGELVKRVGRADLRQECRLAACLAASDYDPGRPGAAPFPVFARTYVRHRLLTLGKKRLSECFWRAWPVCPETSRCADCPAKGVDRESLLAVWCERTWDRRDLGWRERVYLYLACVEGWSASEIGAVWGIRKQSVSSVIQRAVVSLAPHTDPLP